MSRRARPADAGCVSTGGLPPCFPDSSLGQDGHSQPEHGAGGRGPHVDHRHGHGHGAHHGHDHARAAGRRGLKLVLSLTGAFMIVEFVGGWLSNSLALMADAGHMLTDVAALSLALFAMWFARRPATSEKTFGYLRTEILAALLNGVALGIIAIAICVEAYRRLRDPAPVQTPLMLAVAVAGFLVNVIAAFVLHRSAGHSLNVRGAYLHVLGDLLGSVGAIAAALIILGTGWLAADPLISVFVAALILFSSWKLIHESVDVLLEAVPRHIDLAEVRSAIEELPAVDEVHDLHVWSVTSGFLAMSGHAVVPEPERHQEVLEEIHRRMRNRFGIRHVTVQIEQRGIHGVEDHRPA